MPLMCVRAREYTLHWLLLLVLLLLLLLLCLCYFCCCCCCAATAAADVLLQLLLLVLLLLLLLLLFFVLASHVVAQPKRSRALLGVQLSLRVSYTYERAFLRVCFLSLQMCSFLSF